MDIELELHLNAVVDVDDEKGMMKSSGWVGFSWMDEYARWNPAEFGGIKEIRVPASMFWVPDVYLFNDAKGDFQSGILKNDVRVLPRALCGHHLGHQPDQEEARHRRGQIRRQKRNDCQRNGGGGCHPMHDIKTMHSIIIVFHRF